MRQPLVIVSSTLLVLLAGLGAWQLRAPKDAAVSGLAEQVFAQPVRRTMKSSVLATGSIRPRPSGQVRVGSQLSGIVERLFVSVGSKVQAGDMIAKLDSRRLDAQLAQALAVAAEARRDVERAQVEFRRAEQIGSRNLIPRAEIENRQLDVVAAEARLASAVRSAEVVRTDLRYATIRSPITGTVASVSTQEGETVAASFNAPTFATIIDDATLELVATVDETDIARVTPGQAVIFSVESYPGIEFMGQVARIAPTATVVSGVVNYDVIATVNGPTTQLRPDMTANVTVSTAEHDALVIPSAAVQDAGQGPFVYVGGGGELARRTVVVGMRDTAYTEITEGLTAEDRVLIRGFPGNASAKNIS